MNMKLYTSVFNTIHNICSNTNYTELSKYLMKVINNHKYFVNSNIEINNDNSKTFHLDTICFNDYYIILTDALIDKPIVFSIKDNSKRYYISIVLIISNKDIDSSIIHDIVNIIFEKENEDYNISDIVIITSLLYNKIPINNEVIKNIGYELSYDIRDLYDSAVNNHLEGSEILKFIITTLKR